jgi:hypothetical protein
VRFTADSELDERGEARPLTVSSIFSGFCYRGKVKKFGDLCFFGWEGDSVQGKRKGRLGKSYVEGACGGWGESLWSGAVIGICFGGR